MSARWTILRNALPVLALGCLLASCSSTPGVPAADTRALEARALEALEAGDARTAANIFAQLAATAQGSRQAGFLLEAARLEIELNNMLSASELLTRAQNALAPGEQTQRAEVLWARIDIARQRPAEARARARPLLESDNVDIRTAALEIEGLAGFALGQPIEAIRALSEREIWLDDIDSIRDNQQTLWLNLFGVPASTRPTGDEIIDGWVSLAPVARIADQDRQNAALLQWRTEHLQHPAARILLTDILRRSPDEAAGPRQVALLLPLSSAVREQARAIRDGFMAAHMLAANEVSFGAAGAPAPLAGSDVAVRVYDTGAAGAEAAYLQAQVDGADFIVGPLLRNEVESILPQSGIVPTLALNRTLGDDDVFANTFQYALAPEDEAVAVARRAIALGQRRAVVLLPSNDRGYRIFASFQEEFEALGGEVLDFMGYDGAVGTYSNRISTLLNIDRSNARERTLQANLREALEFSPRRRRDIDMVFVIGNAGDGRQLAPQLEFLYAGDIPTYGISEIHDLNAAGISSDLNRIVFPEVPWLIAPDRESLRAQQTIRARWPARSQPMARMFGMGVDSYRIVNSLVTDPFFTSVDGSTGTLRMDPQGRIHRDLPFAQIRSGSVMPLDDVQAPIMPPADEFGLPAAEPIDPGSLSEPGPRTQPGIRTDTFGTRTNPGR